MPLPALCVPSPSCNASFDFLDVSYVAARLLAAIALTNNTVFGEEMIAYSAHAHTHTQTQHTFSLNSDYTGSGDSHNEWKFIISISPLIVLFLSSPNEQITVETFVSLAFAHNTFGLLGLTPYYVLCYRFSTSTIYLFILCTAYAVSACGRGVNAETVASFYFCVCLFCFGVRRMLSIDQFSTIN